MKKILLYITLVFVLVGCIKESIVEDNGSSGQRVRLLINAGTGEFLTPATRTLADENQLNRNLWVIAFNGSDYNATFVEAAQAIQGTGVDIGKYFISLGGTNDPRMLVVIANASDFVQAQAAAFSGKTITQVMELLRYGDPNSAPVAGATALAAPSQVISPFAEPSQQAIPMSAVLAMPSGIGSHSAISSDGTNTGSALLLRRITAKVVVNASAVFSQFKLMGVAVANAPRTGSLVPGQSGGIISSVGNLTNFQRDINTPLITIPEPGGFGDNNSIIYPVYLYESTFAQGTTIIIKGDYLGQVGYYRLRFQNPLTAPIDINRNFEYAFKIISVATGGYPTIAAAMVATDNQTQITAQITSELLTER